MTIEDSIHHLCTRSTTHGSGITTDEQHEQAKKIARDIMRKYQKIEQILKDHDADRMPEDYWYIDKIREVLAESEDKE